MKKESILEMAKRYAEAGNTQAFEGNNDCCNEAVEDFATWVEKQSKKQTKRKC
jgi:predicted acetyltransferase